MVEMKAHVTAESSITYIQDTRVSGRVMDSNGVMLTILGSDGYRYTIESASNGEDSILVMHDSGRRAVKGKVTEIELTEK